MKTMKKLIKLITVCAATVLLFSACTNLFEQLATANKTGNDKLKAGAGTDAGLVVLTPLNTATPGNRINFDANVKQYNVPANTPPQTLLAVDSPVKLICRPQDQNAKVEYKAWLIEDAAGNVLSSPLQLAMTVTGCEAILKNPYGKVKVEAKIIADDPFYNTSYEVFLMRKDPLGSVFAELGVTSKDKDGNTVMLDNSLVYDPGTTTYRIDANEDAETLVVDLKPAGDAPATYVVKDKDGKIIAQSTSSPVVIDPLPGGYTEVVLTVQESGQPPKEYLLNIYKPGDDLTNLKALTTEPVPGFAAGIGAISPAVTISKLSDGNYTMKVGADDRADVKELTVTATPRHKAAAVEYFFADSSGNPVSSLGTEPNKATINQTTGAIANLPDGDTKVIMKVTPKKGPPANHYLTISKAPATSTELAMIVVKTALDFTKISSTVKDEMSLLLDNKTSVVGEYITDIADYTLPKKRGGSPTALYAHSEDYNSHTEVDNLKVLMKHKYAEIALIPFDKDATISVESVSNADAITVKTFTENLDYFWNNAPNAAGRLLKIRDLPDGPTKVTFKITPKTPGIVRTFTVTLIKPDKSNANIRVSIPGWGTGNGGGGNSSSTGTPMAPIKIEDNTKPQTVYVDDRTDWINLALELKHQGATISSVTAKRIEKINGEAINPHKPVAVSPISGTDGVFSCKIGKLSDDPAVDPDCKSLPTGKTEVDIEVKAENGTTKTYTVYIIKAESQETRLRDFVGVGGTFDDFDINKEYKVPASSTPYDQSYELPPGELNSLSVSATALYSGADIELTVAYPEGSGKAPIVKTGTGSALLALPKNADGKYTMGDYTMNAKVSSGDKERTYNGKFTLSLPSVSTLKLFTLKQGSQEMDVTPDFVVDTASPKDFTATASVNRGYDKAITLALNQTDPLATISDMVLGVPVITLESGTLNGTANTDTKAVWNATTKILTLTNYGAAKKITVPVTVVSQAGVSAKTDYTLVITVPELQPVPASNLTSGTPFGPDKPTYWIGKLNDSHPSQIGYRYGSIKPKGTPGPKSDTNDGKGDIGGIDIIGKTAAGWTSSSFGCNLTDGDNNTFVNGGWHYKVKAGSTEKWINIPDNYASTGVGGTFLDTGIDNLKYAMDVSVKFADGIPYVELSHSVKNTGSVAIANVRIGACSDTKINDDDGIKFVKTRYGASMTSTKNDKTYTFGLYCKDGESVNSVDTLYLGDFGSEHLNIFTDNYTNRPLGDLLGGTDTAAAYSWNIGTLAAGATVTKTIRISLGLLNE